MPLSLSDSELTAVMEADKMVGEGHNSVMTLQLRSTGDFQCK
jgi:hypothetical protein